MTKLPILSGKEIIKALSKAGFVSVRQKGSHVFMRKETSEGALVTIVPWHKEVDTGTLAEILRQTKINREEFIKLL